MGEDRPLRHRVLQHHVNYEEADHERDRIIQAYNGSSAVLEDEDYRSATQRRLQISEVISQINDEREFWLLLSGDLGLVRSFASLMRRARAAAGPCAWPVRVAAA